MRHEVEQEVFLSRASRSESSRIKEVSRHAQLCVLPHSMSMSLFVTPKLCTNCGTCESVCDKHVVDVFTFEDDTNSLSIPITCLQCEQAACMDVCPANAIYRDANSTVLVNATKCIGCKLCTSACPFGSIEYNYSVKKILKCDLCDGNPDCVKYCPTTAIVYENATEANMNKKRVIAEKFTGLLELE